MKLRGNIMLAVAAAFVLLVPAVVFGEAIVGIAATGSDGLYEVRGSGFKDVGGVDLVINYDTATLTGPVVSSGPLAPGAMLYANTEFAGSIRIGLVTMGGAINDSGTLATVKFTRKGSGAAALPVLVTNQVRVFSSTGTELAARQETAADQQLPAVNPSGTSPSPQQPSSAAAATNTTTSAAGIQTAVVYGGSLSPAPQTPDEPRREEPRQKEPHREEAQPPPSAAPVTRAAEQAAPAPDAREAKEAVLSPLQRFRSVQSPLARFRAFSGKRELKTLAPLFDAAEQKTKGGLEQTPAIACADGTSPVTVAVELGSGDVPVFSLQGAKLKSIARGSGTSWEVTAVPQKGRLEAKISVSLGREVADIPIIVVPPLSSDALAVIGNLTEERVAALIASKGVPAGARVPLDLDGERGWDYRDEYVLIAHWLLKSRKYAPAAREKAAVK